LTWEYSIARPLLIVHALAGFSVLAIAIHLLVAVIRSRRGQALRFRRRAAMYSRILWPLVLGAVLTGAVVYPAFRVGVRAAYLDQNRPALTGLFEIKEYWGGVVLVLAWSLWRFFKAHDAPPERPLWMGQLAFVSLLTVIAAYNVIAGLILVMAKSV
jgi:hypothetical protein